MDGKGGTAEGVIIDLDKRSCIMEVGEISRESLPQLGLTMIVAPTKKTERFEWFLEKATEIGVERIYPVFTSRSESKTAKFDRWSKVLISAMKQSKRTWLPELKPAMALIDAVREISDSPHLSKNFFVAHCMDAVSLGEKTHLLKAIIPGESTCIAIGPEGDFTSEEVQEMLNSGAKEITLGDMRLRSETAAIVAVTFFAARQV
jgi:16S rRNA (uracil1498-N3)-methyltransferase